MSSFTENIPAGVISRTEGRAVVIDSCGSVPDLNPGDDVSVEPPPGLCSVQNCHVTLVTSPRGGGGGEWLCLGAQFMSW